VLFISLLFVLQMYQLISEEDTVAPRCFPVASRTANKLPSATYSIHDTNSRAHLPVFVDTAWMRCLRIHIFGRAPAVTQHLRLRARGPGRGTHPSAIQSK